MGRPWNGLFGRNKFKTAKLKTLLNLTMTRLVVLKNQRCSRCSHAKSDIAQLLSTTHGHEKALDRAEYVIKEQSMLDVFILVGAYCNFLRERLSFFEHSKVCPEELREAISTLIYVAERTGELPELQDLKAAFTAGYGQDFVSAAVSARSESGVDANIVELMSTKQLPFESKLKVVRDVAEQKGLAFDLDQKANSLKENVELQEVKNTSSLSEVDSPNPPEFYWKKNKLEFKDAATASQAAFEAASFAASAARTAAELCISRSQGRDSGDNSSVLSSEISGNMKIHHVEIDTSESETENRMEYSRAQKGKKVVVSDEDDNDHDDQSDGDNGQGGGFDFDYNRGLFPRPRNRTLIRVDRQSEFDGRSDKEEEDLSTVLLEQQKGIWPRTDEQEEEKKWNSRREFGQELLNKNKKKKKKKWNSRRGFGEEKLNKKKTLAQEPHSRWPE